MAASSLPSMASDQLPHIGDAAGDRARRGGRRARQMRPHLRPLTVFEIAIGGRNYALAGLGAIAVAARTHRAAGFAPEEAGVTEYAVEPRRFRLAFHARRARHDHGEHPIGDAPAFG